MYSGFTAYREHREVPFWQRQVDYWHDAMAARYRDDGKNYNALFNPPERFDEAVRARDYSIQQSQVLTKVSAVLLLFPLWSWILFRAARWIWRGHKVRRV
jgi:hypothetical protein